jgi:colicin import membrane protein
MPAFATEHLRPLLGSVAFHVVLFALLAGAALNWTSKQEPVPIAIEGTVVQYKDLPRSLRSGKPIAEPTPAPAQPKAESRPEPAPDPRIDTEKAEQQARKEAAAAEKRKADDAAAKAKASRETERKAAEAEARRQSEAEAQKLKAAKEKAAQEAKSRAARESELKRALAVEEEGAAVAQSGVVDEYRALLVQTIERNWMRPASARAGLECTLNVTQAAGGTVVDVTIGDCNGDQAVRESITNAVYKSSPLPAPRDPRAFQRRLVIVFKPTE